VNLTQAFDGPAWKKATEIIDPINHLDRLEKLPKYIIVSSDDEFMMFDWTNIYYDKIKGEKYLLITPNAEHTSVTNIVTVISTVATYIRMIASNQPIRPVFNSTFDPETGMIKV
jgi:PhoPQ-activated pathogenicity-related protein